MSTTKKYLFKSFNGQVPFIYMIIFWAVSGEFGDHSYYKPESQNQAFVQKNDIQFEEEVAYSEPVDVMFGNIVTATVDHLGQILMGDNDQKKIHVFSPDGNYLQSFGRRGNGPGEFQMITKIAANPDHVHVFDMIMGRINIFEARNFDFIRTISLSENSGGRIQRGSTERPGLGRPFDFLLMTDGNYLVSFRSMMNLHRPQTAIISPLGDVIQENRFELRTGTNEVVEHLSGNRRIFSTFPFSRTSIFTISANGLLFSNWSENLAFDVYDESGNHVRSFSLPHQNARMDRQELLNMYEHIQGQGIVMGAGAGAGAGSPGGGMPSIQDRLKNMDLPETWPAVDKIYADSQNRLWVTSYTEQAYVRKWYLFDESGFLIGVFNWPANKRVVHAVNDTVYVLDRPVDDLDRVIRYRFISK